jgi:hypothetical protein
MSIDIFKRNKMMNEKYKLKEISLSVLLNNKDKIINILKKYKYAYWKANKESLILSRTFKVFNFILINFLITVPTILFNSEYYFYFNITFSLGFYVYIVCTEKHENSFYRFSMKISQFLFKNTRTCLLSQLIQKEHGLISYKSGKTIDYFHKDLTNLDIYTYEKLIKEKYIDSSYEYIIFDKVKHFLSNNIKSEVLNNKTEILQLMDLLDENSSEAIELNQLYVSKIKEKNVDHKTVRFKNESINALNKLDEKLSENKKTLIKQI